MAKTLNLRPEFQLGGPLPETIGRCADLYHDVRELRLAMEKMVAPVKAREAEIREHIIQNLEKSSDTGAAGERYLARIVTKEKVTVEDWQRVQAYVAKTGRFDLFQRRINETAVKEIWEEGGDVPGAMKFNAVDVSITKL